MKIVFLDAATLSTGDLDLSELHAIGDLTTYERTAPSELLDRVAQADIIITNKVRIGEEHLTSLPHLKYIVVAATGYDVVDIEAARARGISVSNVKGYSSTSVSQHVIAMLLAYLNESGRYFQETKDQHWSAKPDFSYWHKPIIELHGLCFAILGFGDIGKKVARIAVAMGMRTIAYSRHPERDRMEGVDFVSMEEIWTEADVLSLHLPLTSETEGIIDKESISKMKPTSILINTARGGLINDADLAEALEEGKLKAALLDVLSSEPPPSDHILLGISNCYITPHQAWASLAARERLLHGIITNIKGYSAGSAVNVVN